MINYILQVMLFQLAFLVIYDLFLRKETFFVANRFYLLIAPFLSFFIPLIKIPSLRSQYTYEASILLPEIVLSPQSVLESSPLVATVQYNYLALIFWIGFFTFFTLFLMKLYRLIKTIKRSRVEPYNDFKLVVIPKIRKAFSFFNYIFLGEKISDEDKRKIIKHEIVHSRQKHSLDLLLFEFLKIVMWFNPLVYIFQMRIAEVHEFISDSYVIKTTHKEQYINTLLNELFEVDSFSFVNQFAKKSILKTRIMMMTKQKSKQLMQAKYLLLLPLFAGMLFYISCSEEYQNFEYAAKGQEQKMYIYGLNGLEQMTRPGSKSKKSYLDFLIAFSITDLPDGWKEITENDLTNTELQEYEEVMKDYEKLDLKSTSSGMEFDYKLFRDENQRGVLGMIPKFDFEKTNSSSRDNNSEWKIEKSEGVPFSIIDKIPTFPGCDENDKKCFNKRMREHFFNTFDKDLPNKLGLSSGKKRMIMLFVIGSDGVVKSIRAKAPHKALEEEAIRVLNSLPKMIPGENNGEAWSVRYTLPIRIDIQ